MADGCLQEKEKLGGGGEEGGGGGEVRGVGVEIGQGILDQVGKVDYRRKRSQQT